MSRLPKMLFKVRTPTPEISATVQKALFEAGFEWRARGAVPAHLHYGYLYAYSNKSIRYGTEERTFDARQVPELCLDTLEFIYELQAGVSINI